LCGLKGKENEGKTSQSAIAFFGFLFASIGSLQLQPRRHARDTLTLLNDSDLWGTGGAD
jgi:hypothetical protein